MQQDQAAAMGQLYDRLGPTMLAESIKKVVGEAEFYAFLQSKFSSNCSPSVAHNTLLSLGPRCIITTNYDKLIENAFARHHNGSILPRVTYREPGQVRKHLQEGNEFIFKIHGDIDTPRDLILTQSDYLKLQHTEDGYQLVLSAVFIYTTVVFIGFSLTDPEITDHLRRLRNALKKEGLSHFALLPSESVDINKQLELAEDMGISTITFRRGEHGDGLSSLIARIKDAADQPVS